MASKSAGSAAPSTDDDSLVHVPIIDPHLLHGLHLTRLGRAGARTDVPDDDTVFQASSLGALLDGAYEGDLTFGELAAHGDFGIGTL
jgi:acetolactate decarboxylase